MAGVCAHAQLHGYYQNLTAGGTPVEEGLQDLTGGLPLLLLMQLPVDLASAVVAASPAAEARRDDRRRGRGGAAAVGAADESSAARRRVLYTEPGSVYISW